MGRDEDDNDDNGRKNKEKGEGSRGGLYSKRGTFIERYSFRTAQMFNPITILQPVHLSKLP
jgi:hypothetical protein